MRFLLLLALCASTAGAQVFGSKDTNGNPSPYLDSLYTAAGCETQTAEQYRKLADSLSWNVPYTKFLLDSAGIVVWDHMSSAGQSTATSNVMWCPRNQPFIRMAKGTILLIDGSRPALETDNSFGATWRLLALVDRPWIDVNDSTTWRGLTRDSLTALVNFGYSTWRAAIVGLAPRFHVVPAVPLTCDGAPIGFVIKGTSTTAALERTERVTVVRAGVCLGVTTLATATRYKAHIRTATGWRTLTPTYTSRAAAATAVVAANGI